MVEASIDSSDEDIFQNYAGKNGIKPYRFEPKRRRLNVDQHGLRHTVYINDVTNLQSLSESDSFSYADASSPASDAAPSFISKFRSEILQPGPTVSLKCVASGSPTPLITWRLDDRRIEDSNGGRIKSSRHNVNGNGTMEIFKVKKARDDGRYTCIVKGKHGKSATGQLWLKVLG
ncbi:Down syndrome cell adhesion molecule-like protein Dscam2 [Nymphon striatum]|nr:Down syndrome cell adhesion molecule-like protein Dscam2 [Nymphon striatum]